MDNYSNPISKNTAPAAGRQLTLYLPCIAREIALNRSRISFGRGKFCDLDLSQLPGADYLETLEGEFYQGNGAWYFKPEKVLTPARLNDREVTIEHRRLSRGDCLVLGGRVVLIIRDVSQDQPAADELTDDIQMFFESIHLKNGHMGNAVRFDAARRVVLRKSWGIIGKKQLDPTPEELPVPLHITTRKALYQFVRKEKPGWKLYEQKPDSFQEDILLWLDRDCDVQYVAAQKQVRHRQWMNIPGIPDAREQWYTFPRAAGNEEEIREYMRRLLPQLPHNRKSELDADILLSGFEDPCYLNYSARTREVTCSSGIKGPEQKLRIPDYIESRNELMWYLQIHRRNWLGRILHEEQMLRDRLLFSRNSVRGGKIVHEQTHYLAEERSVCYRIWDDGPGGDEYTLMMPLKIPFTICTIEEMVQFVRQRQPNWLGESPANWIPRP